MPDNRSLYKSPEGYAAVMEHYDANLRDWPGAAHESFARTLRLMFQHYRFQSGPRILSDGELRHISSPLFILMGIDEVTCNPHKVVSRAQRLIPTVQTEIVPDAGHVLTRDKPDLVMARLLAFFAGHNE